MRGATVGREKKELDRAHDKKVGGVALRERMSEKEGEIMREGCWR